MSPFLEPWAGVQRLSNSPRYSEACPRISVGEALKSCKAGTPVMLWRNRLDHVVGLAVVRWPEPQSMIVSTHLQSLPYVDEFQGSCEFMIEYKGSTHLNSRPFAVCEGCTRHIDVIIFADDLWRCKACLRLANRSTRIDPVVRISEELRDIEAELKNGRPRHMTMKRFQKLEHRFIELQRELGLRPRRTASSDYLHRIEGEWLAHSDYVSHLVERLA